MISKLALRIVLISALFTSFQASSLADELGNAEVKGTLYGTKVHLKSAQFDGSILEIYDGEGWGFNPSLLIFMFDHKDKVAAGKKIVVSGKEKFSNPHVHSRFKKGKDIECEIDMNEYKMTIKFEQPIRGYLPARFKFSIPGKKTQLTGKFFLDMKKSKLAAK